jgi:hypothetical protein
LPGKKHRQIQPIDATGAQLGLFSGDLNKQTSAIKVWPCAFLFAAHIFKRLRLSVIFFEFTRRQGRWI